MSWVESIRTHRVPLLPIPTEVQPQLPRLDGIRAVIFDVYGTLVVSGSGDVGSADTADHEAAMQQALQAVGISERLDPLPTTEMLHDQIRQMNSARQSEICPKPEVDIVDAWRLMLRSCSLHGEALTVEETVRVAAEYESRANPTYPMPDSSDLLSSLHSAGLPLGIVSNAQVFTLPLVQDLLPGKNLPTPAALEAGGFDLDLCFFSNRFRQSKPGPRLFDGLRMALERRDLSPHEAIYVGNDMLNDVWAASQAGLRTAWFAGDQRSLRRREDDARCRSLRPDLVLTELMQLLDCLEIG